MSKLRCVSAHDIMACVEILCADARDLYYGDPRNIAAQDILAGAAVLLAQATAHRVYDDVADNRTTLEPVSVLEELIRQADRVHTVAVRASTQHGSSLPCAVVVNRLATLLDNMRFTLESGERIRVLNESADTLRNIADALRNHATGPQRTQGEPRPAGFHDVFIKQIMEGLHSVHNNLNAEIKS